MPTKRGPARKSTPIKRKHRFRKKHTHHVTPVRMKELLDEAKALLEEWLVNYDEVEVQVLADLEKKLLVSLEELKALIDDLEAKLDHADWGLAALKALIDDVEAKLDVPGNFKADVAAIEAAVVKLLTGIIQGTGTVLPANKSLYDLLWKDRHTKAHGSFNFPAADTTEKDISALSGGPDLTGTKIRRYWLKLDMTEPAADPAAWTKCTIKIKEKIDNTNYRTISKAEKSKTDLAATAEPGIPIESLPTDVDLVITMQFDVGLTFVKTIYWRWICEKMEY